MKKRILSLMLAFALVASFLPITGRAAVSIDNAQFASKISTLQTIFKHGEYWNYYSASDYSHTGSIPCHGTSKNGTPCATLGYCDYCSDDCGYFAGGYQCEGYARKIANEIFGSYPPYHNAGNGWSKSYSLGTVYAGDIIRVNSDTHTLFVYKVDGTTIYYTECNYSGPCMVTWGRTCSYGQLQGKFTYKLHLDGNTLDGCSQPTAAVPQNVYVATEGTTVGVSWNEAANALSYDVYLVQAPWGWDDIKYSQHVDGSHQYCKFTDVAPGNYSAFVVSRPNDNYTQSKWFPFVVITYTPIDIGDNFYAYIECWSNGSYLTDVDYNVTTLTPPEYAAQPSYDPRQIWHFVRQSNGAYEITNEYSGHCMDASNFGTANGTNVGICQSNDSTAQRWYIIEGADGYGYSICPQYATNLRLDKNGGGETAGNIQLYQSNNSSAQTFSIYKLSDFEDYPALKNYSKPAKPTAPTVFGEQDGAGAIVFCDDVSLVNSKFDSRQYNFYVYKGTSAVGTPILTKTGTTDTVFLIDELEEGTYTAEVRAVNTKYQSYWSTGTATFTIVAGPTITTVSLPSGIQYKDYSMQVSAQGIGTLQWSIKSGNLPAGLTLNATTGTISGKPTEYGSFPVTVTVTDANGTAEKTFTLSVAKNETPVSTKNLEIDYIDATHIDLRFCIQNDTDKSISASIMTAEYAQNGAFVGIHSESKTVQPGENAVSLGISLFDHQNTAKILLLDAVSYAPLTSDLSVNDWILASEIPDGAEIVDEKWTYSLTETDTSYQASMPGWVNTGSSWQQVGDTSTRYYAAYPAGFDTNHTLYSKYEKATLSPHSWSEDNAEYKTDVISTTLQSYIYWHWTWNNAWRSGDNYNVFVAAKYGWDEESQRTHSYFSAFESTTNYGYTDPKGVSGLDSQGRRELDCYYAWFGNVADGSWWWFRFPVYKQTYADFIKEYTFERVTDGIESQAEVMPGNGVSNVQHWVKYRIGQFS